MLGCTGSESTGSGKIDAVLLGGVSSVDIKINAVGVSFDCNMASVVGRISWVPVGTRIAGNPGGGESSS